MTNIVLKPGAIRLDELRSVYEGAVPALDPAGSAKVAAAADVIAGIIAKGDPVYGINTGFGKLASVRIPVRGYRDAAAQPHPVALLRRGRAAGTGNRSIDHGAEACIAGARRFWHTAGDHRADRGDARSWHCAGHPGKGLGWGFG